MVTVSQMLGPREPGSSYGSRDNGPPVNDLTDIPPAEIPTLPNTPVAQTDAELPDHRYRGRELRRPQQRRVGERAAEAARCAPIRRLCSPFS